MDIKKIRIFLWVIFAFVLVVLWTQWQQGHQPAQGHNGASQMAQARTVNSDGSQSQLSPNLDMGHTVSNTVPSTSQKTTVSAGKRITVKTNVLHAEINLNGGNLVAASLLKYPKALHSSQPVQLLATHADKTYVAQSGLISNLLPKSTIRYQTVHSHYVLQQGQKQLLVNLTANVQGIHLLKQYIFKPNDYAVAVRFEVSNHSGKVFQGRFFGQILRTIPKKSGNFLMSYANYTGAAVSYPGNHFDKVSFKDMREQDLHQMSQGGWVAMLQHYFITAWAPGQQQKNEFYSRIYRHDLYTIGFAGPMVTIPMGQAKSVGATLYTGPAIAKNLDQVAPYLDKTINYGWLWFISILIFKVMSWIHHYIGNWGWSIVLVTLLIKLIFYPLSAKSYRSMARMRMLQPKIKQLKEQFADDRQKLGKATMSLYQKEKVNPLGGCLPIVVQIPVFIGLYYMLMASVELRQAPWVLWIHDLSLHDPYYFLPVLMGFSMYLQQMLNPPMPDPTQAKVMKAMPIVFTFMFLGFPAGLVLYWLVNNCVSILQQWYIMRTVTQEASQKVSYKKKK